MNLRPPFAGEVKKGMTCRFYISKEMVARGEGYYEGCCSLGSSSIKVECNGGNDETKCGLALSVIAPS